MALSAPGTPKTNFITPRKQCKTPLDLIKNGTRSQFTTPRSNYTTPKTKKTETCETPDCYNPVALETPMSSTKRRSSKDKFDEINNLTVAVRIRPMNARELAYVGTVDVVRVRDKDLILRSPPNCNMATDHIFQYDHIFWSCDEANPIYATQEDVFMTIGKPLLNSAFRGYNACLFAYGQTGSGKSFSMMGKTMCEIVDIDSEEYSGLTPRFCRDLFDRISHLDPGHVASVEVSYFEIYNEKIRDLLSCTTATTKTPLKVREHPVFGPYVVDLSIHPVKSYNELRNWLLIGNKNRATTATSMNENSSRSHSIFSIELCLSEGINDSDSSRRSKVSLVDLAGSERIGNSTTSEERIKEGVCINKSLLTLGKVISALSDQKKSQFVPYRESVLTWLLRECLGGNSLTSMLATISPASTHLDETLATLRYACQARSIVNRARVNENPNDRLIRELRSEVERLRALRQDYERNSFSSSLILINDSNEELDELRTKLVETESKLYEAQKLWEKKFLETKESQLKELAEAEKYKAELESRVRVLKTMENTVNLSPYRTNFLEELEGMLMEENDGLGLCESDILNDIKNWCRKNGLICTFNRNFLTIVDSVNSKEAVLSLKNFNFEFENIADFMENLMWTEMVKSKKKLGKGEVMTSMNQIYQILASLQPAEDENNLNLLFAKVNKSLQSFEAALLNNVKNNTGPKCVTFNFNNMGDL